MGLCPKRVTTSRTAADKRDIFFIFLIYSKIIIKSIIIYIGFV